MEDKIETLNKLIEFGILNIDKCDGPTSFQVAEFVGRGIGATKFSHFGTLDPMVTGVLPIALNRACKLTGFFMKKNKTYVGVMKIHKEISEVKLKEEMKKFVGKIMQLPPVRSRVKREEREREVYYWKILEYDKEKKEVLFEVECEAGTYIRKLISDLGDIIGGAHMSELRRTKAGIFTENDKNFVNLYELEKYVEEAEKGDYDNLIRVIIPAEECIKKIMPVVQINNKEMKQILTGKPLFNEDIIGKFNYKPEDIIAVFNEDIFIGIYRVVDEGDIIARAEFVKN